MAVECLNMKLFFIVLSIINAIICSLKSSKDIKGIIYLNRKFTLNEWDHIRSIISCWSSDGNWIVNSNQIFLKTTGYNIALSSPCYNPLIGDYYGTAGGACLKSLDQNMSQYQWKTDSNAFCTKKYSLQSFSMKNLCEIMNHMNIMIVGDSMNQHLSVSLRSMSWVGQPRLPTKQECITSYSHPINYSKMQNIVWAKYFQFPCNTITNTNTGQVDNKPLGSIEYGRKHLSTKQSKKQSKYQVSSSALETKIDEENFKSKEKPQEQINTASVELITIRNDRLSLNTNEIIDSKKNFHEMPWIQELDASKVSLLILNRGSHYENDSKLIFDINNTLSYLTTYHSNVSIIWRNTPYGHLSFKTMRYHAPLKMIPVAPTTWNYDKFDNQNILVKELLDKYYPNVIYLDVYRLTMLRADSHADSLHYCHPGPINTWSILIYNIINLIGNYKVL